VDWQQSAKLVVAGQKRRNMLLVVCGTFNILIRSSCFGVPLPVLHFVADPRTSVRLHINVMEINFWHYVNYICVISDKNNTLTDC